MKRNANVTSKEIMEKGKKLQVKATAYCGSQKTATGTWAKVKHTYLTERKYISQS